MKKRHKHKKLLSLAEPKKRTPLPIWSTLLVMFVIGFIYGFASVRCECTSKLGCANCSSLEAGLLSAVGFVLISLIPILIAYLIIRYRRKLFK